MRELECNRALLTMALTSGTDIFVLAFDYRITVLIFTVTKLTKTLLTVIN